MNCNEEVTIKIIGKVTLKYPNIDQFKLRDILDEVLINYDVQPKENHLIVSDIPEKIKYFITIDVNPRDFSHEMKRQYIK